MLTAKSQEEDKVKGLSSGADDYVTKPFSIPELMARVKAVLKRFSNESDIYQLNGLKIDDKAHEVSIDDNSVYLTPKEYDLLKYFVSNNNIALSREKILNEVWGYDFFGEDRTVDTHVKMLRNNLEKYRDKIVTVRGMGYKFEE